jgi:hypothetical protein
VLPPAKGSTPVAQYFFRLTEEVQSARDFGEEFPNDDAAKAHARKVESEINYNSNDNYKRVFVFSAAGECLA